MDRHGSINQISTNTASDTCAMIIEEWVHRCSTHHSCGRITDPHWMPTRLLDIGDNIDSRPRLCHRDAIPPGSRYLTLSHCWGKDPIYTLNNSTAEEMKQGIPLDKLSQTFRDALTISHKLGKGYGIRHLWIDSLCIYQDSAGDWTIESALMSSVYGNSWCNIAATASSDGRGGCFRERNPLLVQPCKIQAEWEGLKKAEYHCLDTRQWRREVAEAPLNTRAWVVQERFLSPRVLHFSANQVYWECEELDASEMYSVGMPETTDMRFKDVHPTRLAYVAVNDISPLVNPSLISYDIWKKIIAIYTATNITKDTDKLVAISGIATHMKTHIGSGTDEYLAGLWSGHFAAQLLWQAVHVPPVQGILRKSRPPVYCAPSWSWASVNANIVFDSYISRESRIQRASPANHNQCPLVTILSRCVIPASSSAPFGHSTGGEIRLQGHVIPIVLKKDELDTGTGDSDTFADMYIGGTKVESLNSSDAGFVSGGYGENLYCLPFRRSEVNRGWKVPWANGLILQAIASAKGKFQRFGKFDMFGVRACETLSSYFNVPDLDYEEKTEDNKYIITII
jgi:hypothetical protein